MVALEEWRKDTESDSRKSQDQFDKALMTLSAGGISVTIAFLDKIVPFHEASLKWLLFLIWLLWGICLVATVYSFYFSNLGLSCSARQIADEIAAVRIARDPDSVPGPKNDGGVWNVFTKILNQIAACLFLFGLLALLFFIWYNLFMTTPKHENQKLNEGQPATSRPLAAPLDTKELTSSQRPTGTDPSPASSTNTSSGSASIGGETKK